VETPLSLDSPGLRIARTASLGAVAGVVATFFVLVLLASVLIGKVEADPLGDGTARAAPVFDFPGLSWDLPQLVTLGGVTYFEKTLNLSPLTMTTLWSMFAFGLVGLIAAGLTRWVPAAFDSGAVTARRNLPVLAIGGGIGSTVGLLAAQGAATWLGKSGATLQLPILPAVVMALAAGAVAGSGAAGTAHLLSRPDLLGLGGAWETPRQFLAASARAVAIPALALAGMGAVVAAFAGLFLSGSRTLTLVAAIMLAAGILGVASLVAYRR